MCTKIRALRRCGVAGTCNNATSSLSFTMMISREQCLYPRAREAGGSSLMRKWFSEEIISFWWVVSDVWICG